MKKLEEKLNELIGLSNRRIVRNILDSVTKQLTQRREELSGPDSRHAPRCYKCRNDYDKRESNYE